VAASEAFVKRACISVLASLGVYAYLGIGSAILIVALILVHEAGHYWALRRLGYRPVAVRLRPFSGGSVVVAGIDETRIESAFVALAGPLFAMLGALVVVGGAPWWEMILGTPGLDHAARVAATVCLVQNILNLLPITRSDGARVLRVLPVLGSGGACVALGLLAVMRGHGVAGAVLLACAAAVTLVGTRLSPPARAPKLALCTLAATYGLLWLVGIGALSALLPALPLSTWTSLGG
jgi:hypothetical protein